MYNPNAVIAKEICEILKSVNLTDSTKLVVSYSIADFISKKYELKPKKEETCGKKKEIQLTLPLKIKNSRRNQTNENSNLC